MERTDRRDPSPYNRPWPVYPAGVVVFLAVVSASAQEATFHANADYVLLDVGVTTSRGVPVAGLTQDRFELRDNGRRQEIARLESGSSSVSVMVVADFSGSMRPRQHPLALGVAALAALLESGDESRLILFNETAWPLDAIAPAGWDRAILDRLPGGRTALYDAIRQAIAEFEHLSHQRRVMVVLSDGADTASLIAKSSLFETLRDSGVLVYSVGLFEPGEPDTDAGFLRDLAARSGGVAYFDPDATGLPDVFGRMMQDLRARYVLMFRAAQAAPGQSMVRKISVRVRDETGKSLRVRTRGEYSVAGH